MDTDFTSGLKDECGVMGMFDMSGADVARDVGFGLFALQHRGHISCGIVANDNYSLTSIKANGLVNEVFNVKNIATLKGNIAVGHVRYSFVSDSKEHIQPLTSRYCKGTVALAKNGMITNAEKLMEELENEGAIFQTDRDTELVLHLLARARTHCPSVQTAMLEVMGQLEGAYSMCLMSPKKLLAVRDPHGYRPLCIGKKGSAYVIASETCAFDSIGAQLIRDVEPGEIIMIDANGMRSYTDYCGQDRRHCLYEYAYFSRPDSVIDGSSVYAVRKNAGAVLAKLCPAPGAEVVFGVPDGGASFAQGYALGSGLPLQTGIIKNKFSSRNLFSLEEKGRLIAINVKYNILKANVTGKNVVLVDDSLVKGETAAKIIGLLKEAGAKKVHLRIGTPKILQPCPLGIQMPHDEKLFAVHFKTEEEMCRHLGCDSIGFLPMSAVSDVGLNVSQGYCSECFIKNPRADRRKKNTN